MTKSEIQNAFKSELGRDPTMEEYQHFSKLAEGYGGQGQMTPYDIQQTLGGTTEGQLKGLDKYTAMYNQQLAQQDQATMGQAQSQLTSQFRQMGRPSSSGYVSAFADAASKLAQARQQASGAFYAQGLQGVMQNQVSTGQNVLGRAQSQADSQKAFEREQSLNLQNYYRQQNDYNNYLNASNRSGKAQGMFGLGSSLLGAGIGALAAAPTGGMSIGMGAMLGGSLGGGIGRSAGGLF